MRIKIDTLEGLFQLMRRPPLDDVLSSGEEWKVKTEDHEVKRSLPFGFQYHTTGLVYPLDDVSVVFKQFGDNYSCAILIDSLDKTVFNETYHRLTDAIKKSEKCPGYRFVRKNPLRTGDDSTGHFFNLKGDCVFSLFAANKGFMRVLAMGVAGSYTRDVSDNVDKFIQEVGTLESLTNIFIDCLLRPYSNREDVRYLQDKVLYVNP